MGQCDFFFLVLSALWGMAMTIGFAPSSLTGAFDAQHLRPTADFGGNGSIAANGDRVLLVVISLQAAEVKVSPFPITDFDDGIRILSGGEPLFLKFADWGSILGWAWHFVAGPMQVVNFYDVTYKPSLLGKVFRRKGVVPSVSNLQKSDGRLSPIPERLPSGRLTQKL